MFLGSFRPQAGKPHVWELGSDAYLHTGDPALLRASYTLHACTGGMQRVPEVKPASQLGVQHLCACLGFVHNMLPPSSRFHLALLSHPCRPRARPRPSSQHG